MTESEPKKESNIDKIPDKDWNKSTLKEILKYMDTVKEKYQWIYRAVHALRIDQLDKDHDVYYFLSMLAASKEFRECIEHQLKENDK